MTQAAESFFIPMGAGYRYAIYHPAQTSFPIGKVIYAHPFAEELNKTRRMAALQARAMAKAGFAVLQVDLLGCGDSSGDFGDATGERWIQDLLVAGKWLEEQAQLAGMPLWIWGLRAGCLLATQVARQIPGPCNLLFWQPVSSGAVHLQQFLRLLVAAQLLNGADQDREPRGARQMLSEGHTVEVAGYKISSALAADMEQLKLQPPEVGTTPGRRLVWFELSADPQSAWGTSSARALETWREAGWSVDSKILPGPLSGKPLKQK